MSDPDFDDLSMDHLQQILKLLDKEKNPELAQRISTAMYRKRIAAQQAEESTASKITSPFKKRLPAWSHLLTAGLLFALALYIHFSNKIPLLNIPLHLEGGGFTKLALVLSCSGSGVLSLFHFFKEQFGKKK